MNEWIQCQYKAKKIDEMADGEAKDKAKAAAKKQAEADFKLIDQSGNGTISL